VGYAEKVLIVGGIAALWVGVVTGMFMGRVRETEPVVPKYLNLAHVGGFMAGPMLLGLVFALALSDLSDTLEALAAWALVASAGLLAVKDLHNWRTGVVDEFAERSLGFRLGVASSVLLVAGLATLTVGVVSGI